MAPVKTQECNKYTILHISQGYHKYSQNQQQHHTNVMHTIHRIHSGINNPPTHRDDSPFYLPSFLPSFFPSSFLLFFLSFEPPTPGRKVYPPLPPPGHQPGKLRKCRAFFYPHLFDTVSSIDVELRFGNKLAVKVPTTNPKMKKRTPRNQWKNNTNIMSNT